MSSCTRLCDEVCEDPECYEMCWEYCDELSSGYINSPDPLKEPR